MTGSKSTIDLNLLFLFLPEIWYLKPKTKLTKCVFSFNKYWIFHFVPSEPESTVFFYPYFHRQKHYKLKQYEANTLAFLLCYSFNVAKAVNKKCCRNSWKAPANNFLFSYCCKLEATLLLQRLLKSQVLTKCFSLILSWQLCRATISKNAFFSSTASAATSVDYTIDYIIRHHFG